MTRLRIYLSPVELDIMRRVAAGATSAAIAAEREITAGTVKSHLTNVYRELHARDRAHAVAILDDRLPGWRRAA